MAVCKLLLDLRFLTSTLPVGSYPIKKDERAKRREKVCSIREQLRSLQQSTWPHTEEGGHTPGPGLQTTQALPGSPVAHSPSIPSLRLFLRSSPLSSSQLQPRRLLGNYVKHKASNTGEKTPLPWAQQTCDAKKERRLQIEIETWGAQLHPKLLLPPGGEARTGALCHTANSPLHSVPCMQSFPI